MLPLLWTWCFLLLIIKQQPQCCRQANYSVFLPCALPRLLAVSRRLSCCSPVCHTRVLLEASQMFFFRSVCRRYFAWKRRLIFICVLLLFVFTHFLSWSFYFFERSAIGGNSSCSFLFANDATCWLPGAFSASSLDVRQLSTHDHFYFAMEAGARREESFFLMVIQESRQPENRPWVWMLRVSQQH